MNLTRTQRAKLFAGNPVTLTFPGSEPCPYPIGHIEVLSAHVRIEVTEIRRTKEGDHSLGYTLHNQRLGDRYMAKQQGQSHPEQYVSSPAGGIDQEAGAAVDEYTQTRFTKNSHAQHLAEAERVIGEAEEVLRLLKERAEANPEFKREAKLTLHRMRKEIDRLIERQRRKAA